ncbi:hypothetical protein GLOIN_2v1793903 [Rhizophagus clarus]|uniref:FAR1 domain-containing protein n=1 Tax=Rhizophagus clarus TaxID=94130 RepID=A0A8H3KR66_9GLOM|nr:hypothetical protein GLOIN_2v1793903 [Rhizophagus clarus]
MSFMLDRSEHNDNIPVGEYRKLSIVCQHFSKPKKPLAELSSNNNIKKNYKIVKTKINKSIQLGCKAHINLLRPEQNNVNQYIFVITTINNHCHELDP